RLWHFPGALPDRALAPILAVRLRSARDRQGGGRLRAYGCAELGVDGSVAENSRRTPRFMKASGPAAVHVSRKPAFEAGSNCRNRNRRLARDLEGGTTRGAGPHARAF